MIRPRLSSPTRLPAPSNVCDSAHACNALVPWVSDSKHTYVTYIALTASPGVPLFETPKDAVTLPNADGVSTWELNGGDIPSEACTTAKHGDPINSATGEFYEHVRDLGVACVGPPVIWSRTYSSQGDGSDGGLGVNWSVNYGMHLRVVEGGTLATATHLEVVQENGSIIPVYGDPTFGYDVPVRVHAKFKKLEGGGFLLKRGIDEAFYFDSGGLLSRLVDRNGNEVNVARDATGRVDHVDDDFGRSLDAVWVGDHISTVTDDTGRVFTYAYDSNDDLVSVTDFNGLVTTYTYDAEHRMLTMTAPTGFVVTNTYDAQGRVVEQDQSDGLSTYLAYGAGWVDVTDAAGTVTRDVYDGYLLASETVAYGTSLAATTSYEYDDANNLVKMTDAAGNAFTYAYNRKGLKTSETGPLGYEQHWSYTAGGRPITTGASGTVGGSTRCYDSKSNLTGGFLFGQAPTTYEYESHGLTSRVDLPTGEHKIITYNGHGHPTSETLSDGSKFTTAYDPLGNPSAITQYRDRDGDGTKEADTTTFTYNNRSQMLTMTDALGATTTYTYDAYGRLVSAEDAQGATTTYAYDPSGRRTSATDAEGLTTTYNYDAAGRLASVTGPGGAVTSYDYDLLGRITAVTNSLGQSVSYEYDVLGQNTAVVDELGRRSQSEYDALRRVTHQTNPAGGVVTYNYNLKSQLESVVDAGGRSTDFAYDKWGRLKSKTRADGESWSYTYDNDAGQLESATDWLGRVESVDRDGFGRPTTITDFQGLTTSVSYRDGLVAQVTAPSGLVSTPTYDALGRATTVAHSGDVAPTVSTYDSVGNLTGVSDDGGQSSYAYDSLGRVTSATGALGDVQYGYDALGNFDTLTYPSGLVVTYDHDVLGQLTAVNIPNKGSISVSRDAAGSVTDVGYPNGVDLQVSYDAGARVDGTLLTGPGANALFAESYAYGTDGLMTAQSFSRGGAVTQSRDVVRDDIGRVGSITDQAAALSTLTYRASHEVLTDDMGSTLSFSTGGQLDSLVTAGAETITYAYNALGQRTSSSAVTGVDAQSFTYDLLGQLSSVTSGAATYDYTYSQGLRTSADDGTQTTQYVWDTSAGVPVLLEDGENAYVYAGGSTPLAQVSLATGDVTYLHGDLTGSVRAATDESGTVVGTWDYSAYGQVTASTGNAQVTRFGFAGEYRDPTGLYYLRARYLDPVSGQFLTVDPWDGSTGMPYAYTAGDPFQQSDPMGLSSGRSEPGQSFSDGVGDLFSAPFQEFECDRSKLGFWGAVNKNYNPMYHYLEHESAAWDSMLQGDVVGFAKNSYFATLDVLDAALIAAPFASIAVRGVRLAESAVAGARGRFAEAYPGGWRTALADDTGSIGIGNAAANTAADVPTVVFSRSRAPGIAQNFDDAVANGAPTQLNRVSAAARDANRRAALRGQSPAPAGQSLDEYPFACSAQGGCGSFVRSVPQGEQSYQGGVLSRFFHNNGVGVGDPFNVVFGP